MGIEQSNLILPDQEKSDIIGSYFAGQDLDSPEWRCDLAALFDILEISAEAELNHLAKPEFNNYVKVNQKCFWCKGTGEFDGDKCPECSGTGKNPDVFIYISLADYLKEGEGK